MLDNSALEDLLEKMMTPLPAKTRWLIYEADSR
jgi:hypothetical protein